LPPPCNLRQGGWMDATRMLSGYERVYATHAGSPQNGKAEHTHHRHPTPTPHNHHHHHHHHHHHDETRLWLIPRSLPKPGGWGLGRGESELRRFLSSMISTHRLPPQGEENPNLNQHTPPPHRNPRNPAICCNRQPPTRDEL
jgi:hypothetical protein